MLIKLQCAFHAMPVWRLRISVYSAAVLWTAWWTGIRASSAWKLKRGSFYSPCLICYWTVRSWCRRGVGEKDGRGAVWNGSRKSRNFTSKCRCCQFFCGITWKGEPVQDSLGFLHQIQDLHPESYFLWCQGFRYGNLSLSLWGERWGTCQQLALSV